MIGLMSSEPHITNNTSQITSRYYLYIIRIHWEDVFQKSWTVIYPFFSVQYAVLSSSTEFCHTLGIMHISAGDFWLFWYFWQQTGHVLALLARILQCMPVSASTVQNWLTKFVQYSFCSLAFLQSDFFYIFWAVCLQNFPCLTLSGEKSWQWYMYTTDRHTRTMLNSLRRVGSEDTTGQ